MKILVLLLGCTTAIALGACSSNKTETPLQQASGLPPGTTSKGADGSKIKKQVDGDLKVKDAPGNAVKQQVDTSPVEARITK